MKEREITALETALGYHFRRRAVIEQALTHSSQAREQESQQAGENKYRVNDNEHWSFWAMRFWRWSRAKNYSSGFRNFARASFRSCALIW